MNNAGKQTSDLEDRIMDIMKSGQQIEPNEKKSENSIRDLWGDVK